MSDRTPLPPDFGPRTRLSYEQWAIAWTAIVEWLRIRAKHEPRFAEILSWGPERAATQLGADVAHSALLQRMVVLGKHPLPEPPPLRHSYPDYDAVEGRSDG